MTASDPKIVGFIFEHKDDDLSVWTVDLNEEDKKRILHILTEYESKGCSTRGGITYENLTSVRNVGWIPVSLGLYPEDCQNVQVTYIGVDKKYHSDEIAYMLSGRWIWSDGVDVLTEIVAWRHLDPPYEPGRKKVKINRRKKNELREHKD